MQHHLKVSAVFPDDHRRALLVGRVWIEGAGAVLVLVRDNAIYDLSGIAATCSDLLQLNEIKLNGYMTRGNTILVC